MTELQVYNVQFALLRQTKTSGPQYYFTEARKFKLPPLEEHNEREVTLYTSVRSMFHMAQSHTVF